MYALMYSTSKKYKLLNKKNIIEFVSASFMEKPLSEAMSLTETKLSYFIWYIAHLTVTADIKSQLYLTFK